MESPTSFLLNLIFLIVVIAIINESQNNKNPVSFES